jgi:hypothetical protein
MKWVKFWKSLWQFFVVTLEHNTCLCLILQLGNMLVSESYNSYDSSYSFDSPKECPSDHRTMFWSISQSSQCFQVICHASQYLREVSLQTNHSIVLPSFILMPIHTHLIHHLISLSFVWFVSMMRDTSWPSFDEFFLVDFNMLSRN